MTGIGSGVGQGITGIQQDKDDEIVDIPVGSIPQDGYMVNRSGTIIGEKQLYTPPVAVTGDAFDVFTADASLGNIFTLTVVASAPTTTTIATPTNIKAGATYMWIITQNGAGNGELGFSADFKFPGGTLHTLTTSPGAIDVLTAVAVSASELLVVGQADFQ
jgi:hypothetical protein